ncbi:MAG: deoxyguanosinetriphosphate triphosphohydrolase, partial [Verrucomicrobiota bacterium]
EDYYSPSLEAQIANLADEITYYSHDLDDGLDFSLITARQLAGLEVWQQSVKEVRSHFPSLRGRELCSYAIRCMIDRQVHDVISTSAARIQSAGVQSVEDVRRHKSALIAYSEPLLHANRQLRRFLYKNLYYHPTVESVNLRACTLLREVFEAYLRAPELLGVSTARRLRKEGLHRTVCDYLSGMTDRYLLEEHQRLCPRQAVEPLPST